MEESVVVDELDIARSSRVFLVEIRYKVWGVNIVLRFPGIMFYSKILLLD